MAGFGGSYSPSRYTPTTRSSSGTGAGIRLTPTNDFYTSSMQAQRQQESAKARLGRSRLQEIEASNAGHQARMYGVDVMSRGMGGNGPYQVSAPGGGTGGGTTAARRAAAGSGGGGGGADYGYKDLTKANYNSALNKMPAIPGREAPISMLDRSAAEGAAYGRARDAAGAEARGASDALADEMSARGIGGSGIEGALLSQIVQKGQGQLGEVNREQAIDRMKRADEVQNINYQGGVQQRGQDISAQEGRQSNAMRLMELLRRRRRVA